ncbi:MAG: adenosine kinase [Hyphomicrobiaceae bacterium]
MSAPTIDVIGIGNAIVDVIARSDDSTLSDLNLPKGGMQLIEESDIDRLYNAMAPAQERSGGSAANTMAGIASFGGTAGLIARVADDEFGKIFAHDIRSIGVSFESTPITDSDPTARCLIFVTPDGERTMNTYLGCSPALDKTEITPEHIQSANILYLEGYLFDRDEARNAFHQACSIAKAAETRISLSLSDTFCVERHRDAFRELIDTHVDILFANEDELRALTGNNNVEEATSQLAGSNKTIVTTRSAAGSFISHRSENHKILSQPVKEVVDTTGAGDLYAAGFLYGYARGLKINECGNLGSMAAAEVISHIGARPEISLRKLAEEKELNIGS